MDSYATAIPVIGSTGWRGAVYNRRLSPSGSERWRLSVTMNREHASPADAVAEVSALLPNIPTFVPEGRLDASAVPPKGSVVTVVTPRDGSGKTVDVVFEGASIVPAPSAEAVAEMVAREILVLDTSSGDDPELSAVYDVYLRAP